MIQPQLADVMKDLDYRGIHWDAELAEEGTGWEVAAEPEPQYFETLREALDFFVSLKEPQAGSDRGQQDAPDEKTLVRQRVRQYKERIPCGNPTCKHVHLGRCAFCDCLQIEPAAKAAREGQAPKGDRIKVEREPGCKCEYAIWTNARGCPLHDVSDPVQAQKE